MAIKGAFRHPQLIYTPPQVQTVVKEAYVPGIRVIPEWDMLGHTAAIAKSHPELMSDCPHPSEPLNHTLLETYYNYQSSIDNDVDIGGAVAVAVAVAVDVAVDVDVDISLHNNRRR